MNNTKKHLINNKKEIKRVLCSLIFLGIITLFIGILVVQNYFQLYLIDFKLLRRFGKTLGQSAAYGFGLVIGLYVIRRIAKLDLLKNFKKDIILFAKILREWHAPLAIIAFSVIILHAYIMLSRGIFLTPRYISGILALLILAIQITSGFFRYKRIGIKFHMVLGILFIMSMGIHILL